MIEDINSVLAFGKYNGKSIKEVVLCDLSYLNWCLSTIDDFILSEKVIGEIKKLKPKSKFTGLNTAQPSNKNIFERFGIYVPNRPLIYSETALKSINAKADSLIEKNQEENFNWESNINWDKENYDALTDGQSGSYNDFFGIDPNEPNEREDFD